jgi:hypothetical protein
MADFESLAAIQSELEILSHQPEPLVRLLARQPGQKEDRWQQLVAAESTEVGPPDVGPGGGVFPATPTPPPGDGPRPATAAGAEQSGLDERIRTLEADLADVKGELGELRSSLDDLRRSLGE